VDVTHWPVLRTLEWVKKLAGSQTPSPPPAGDLRAYPEGDQHPAELPGGRGFGLPDPAALCSHSRRCEAQRIRLATQIGSRLMGVLYVLDEPSIGLHPRDNTRLLNTLKVCGLGNTVLVVEHDEETIRTAD